MGFGLGIGTLGGGDFFQVGLENSLDKNNEYKSQAKKYSDCNFYNSSLLVPYPNKFVVFVFVFSMVYTPPYPQFCFFVFFIFSCLVARDWEYFRFLGDLLYWEILISFLERGARPFSSIKPSVTNHVDSKTVDGKIICFMCAC